MPGFLFDLFMCFVYMVFPRPVSFTTVNEILVELNFKQQTFVSPVRVDRAVFNKIYTLATGIA